MPVSFNQRANHLQGTWCRPRALRWRPRRVVPPLFFVQFRGFSIAASSAAPALTIPFQTLPGKVSIWPNAACILAPKPLSFRIIHLFCFSKLNRNFLFFWLSLVKFEFGKQPPINCAKARAAAGDVARGLSGAGTHSGYFQMVSGGRCLGVPNTMQEK